MESKSIILAAVLLIGVVLVSGCAYFTQDKDIDTTIPKRPIHWNPNLKIIINGEEQVIPNDIGLGGGPGKIMDAHLSGMSMSPTHTHEEGDGTLHIENNNPSSKPETLTLGYFFKVWDKQFSETCIFEFCNDGEKKVTMTVNGKENTEFGKYVMRDKDEIVITYS